jgi:Cft2 family RNA processing exonuclease
MIHVTRPEGTLLYTGDFKLRDCLTVAAAEPRRRRAGDGEHVRLPLFRFPPWRQVVDQLLDVVAAAMKDGRQPS